MVHALHTILYVKDPDVSREFYRRVLGTAPRLDVPGMIELDIAPGAVLGLMPEDGITRLLGGAVDPSRLRHPGRAELYVVTDDAAGYHARALAAGATELSPLSRRSWGHVAAYSLDPDGYVVAFASLAG